MSSAHNGQQESNGEPERLRFEGFGGRSVLRSSRLPRSPLQTAIARLIPQGHSGRRFVVVAVCTISALWGLLYFFFRDWRERYHVRAAYGATKVVPAIDPLAAIVPPGVDPDLWRDAVRRTHDMLLTVTSSNLLDIGQMRELHAELEQAVGRARAEPRTARDELARIWNSIADRGGFLLEVERSPAIERHPRPQILPPRPERPRTRSDGKSG
jgi:hypothetical protein